MRRLPIALCIILVLGHLLTESGELIEHAIPELKQVYIHPFISSSYKFPYPEGINILWWIYYCTNDLLWIFTFFCAAVIASNYSFRLFRVCAVFFVYHVIDHFMLWYNYKTGHVLYWFMGLAIIACTISMFLPERKSGRVASME